MLIGDNMYSTALGTDTHLNVGDEYESHAFGTIRTEQFACGQRYAQSARLPWRGTTDISRITCEACRSTLPRQYREYSRRCA